ncbi:MAG: hypothetical protein BWY82_00631 [Verrucomicrobia bacterium ADurb.Bin474]|nr:MAG: hypothetical protein BWY82_00631 [Verrucomicrobia bacterium ADurb.Bin474]
MHQSSHRLNIRRRHRIRQIAPRGQYETVFASLVQTFNRVLLALQRRAQKQSRGELQVSAKGLPRFAGN